MLTPTVTKQFEHDAKRIKKLAKYLEKIEIIIRSIVVEETRDDIHRDHTLIGLEEATGMPHRILLAADLYG
jgi:mRNA-degrading endonuclease YafQ of YafQ-DinJ toxin-antitoxin module